MLIKIGFYLVELRGGSWFGRVFLVLESLWGYGVCEGKSSYVMLLGLVVCFVLWINGSFILPLLGCC